MSSIFTLTKNHNVVDSRKTEYLHYALARYYQYVAVVDVGMANISSP